MATRLQPDAQEFPCDTPITAAIRIGGGLITARGDAIASAFVTVAPYDDSDASRATAENARVEFAGGWLRVEVPEGGASGRIFRRNGRVRVDLRLPMGSSLQAHTGSGDVITDGSLGDVSVQTGSGDTVVAQTTGDLTTTSGSGDLRAVDVGGSLSARTGSGDVSATIVRGEASTNTASGDVRIDEVNGSVRVGTASGDVRIDCATGDQVRVTSASGDVLVGVPTGTRVWLDLTTVSGSTSSDLAMTDGPTAPQEGTFVTLQVRTVSGDISVRRALPPAPRPTPTTD